MDKLEKRMYFFTMYNISEIAKGIQCGHAALEYAYMYSDNEDYIDFIENYKTWVILSGGSSNNMGKTFYDNIEYYGSIEGILNEIKDNNIKHSSFNEPDLNNATSAICFLADERVFKYDDYPDFKEWIINTYNFNYEQKQRLFNTDSDKYNIYYSKYYNEWVEILGGVKNVFLRNSGLTYSFKE